MKLTMVRCDRCQKIFPIEQNSICRFEKEYTDQYETMIVYDFCNECAIKIMDITDKFVADQEEETQEEPEKKRTGPKKTKKIDKDKMLEMRKAGKTYAEIAKEWDIAESYCFSIIRSKEIEKDAVEIDDGKIMALWKAGRSIEWIADDMNVSPERVSKRIKELS